VVGLLLQFDPVPNAEPPGHLARELNPARPVQRRVLASMQGGLALLVGGRVPYRLAARRPSLTAIVRRTCDDTAGLWVTTRTVP
jgi:hypothetical protein